MSQAHIDLIRRGFEAFNRGDWDAALAFVAEDVVWAAYLASMDGERAIFGHESLRRTWQAQRDDLGGEDFRIEAGTFETSAPARSSSSFASQDAEHRAASRFALSTSSSGPCVGTSSCDSTTTPARPRPSKPPGCRSRRSLLLCAKSRSVALFTRKQ